MLISAKTLKNKGPARSNGNDKLIITMTYLFMPNQYKTDILWSNGGLLQQHIVSGHYRNKKIMGSFVGFGGRGRLILS